MINRCSSLKMAQSQTSGCQGRDCFVITYSRSLLVLRLLIHELVRTVVEHVEQAEQAKIVHCSLAVVNQPRCHIELEVFAVMCTGHAVDARKAFGFYRQLLGRDTSFRHGLRAFVSRPLNSETAQMLGFGPLAGPLVGSNVGYLQADLLSRPPYMSASTTRAPKVALMPQQDRATLLSEGREIGEWNWWRWNWNPGHPFG